MPKPPTESARGAVCTLVWVGGTAATEIAQGTAFFIDKTHIVTNWHVAASGPFVDGMQLPMLVLQNGTVLRLSGSRVCWFDRTADLAVLSLPEPPIRIEQNEAGLWVPMGAVTNWDPACLVDRAEPPSVGSDVYVIGSPKGLEGTLTKGIVSAERGVRGSADARVQVDANVSAGSSGSPILDSDGNVFAVVTSKMPDAEGLSFGVPIRFLPAANEWPVNGPSLATWASQQVTDAEETTAGRAYEAAKTLMLDFLDSLDSGIPAGSDNLRPTEWGAVVSTRDVRRCREIIANDMPEHLDPEASMDAPRPAWDRARAWAPDDLRGRLSDLARQASRAGSERREVLQWIAAMEPSPQTWKAAVEHGVSGEIARYNLAEACVQRALGGLIAAASGEPPSMITALFLRGTPVFEALDSTDTSVPANLEALRLEMLVFLHALEDAQHASGLLASLASDNPKWRQIAGWWHWQGLAKLAAGDAKGGGEALAQRLQVTAPFVIPGSELGKLVAALLELDRISATDVDFLVGSLLDTCESGGDFEHTGNDEARASRAANTRLAISFTCQELSTLIDACEPVLGPDRLEKYRRRIAALNARVKKP